MSHISSIGAALFTNLAVSGLVTSNVAANLSPANISAIVNAASDAARQTALAAYFVTTTSIRQYTLLNNVRDFPAVGTPSNIVNVPVYGQKQSQTIGGQSDAPQIELTINYVPADWAKGASGTALGNMVGDGLARVWRFSLLNADPSVTATASLSKYDSATGGFGTTENTQYYWIGKLESLLVTPSLTDATTATVGFSVQSDFYGAYTTA
jgi:hypothetical protein